MHYLITGHTGFKGSWLAFMLLMQGEKVSGISLNPLHGSLFVRAGLESDLSHDVRGDIRDERTLANVFREISPDVVIHMAAQPLVRLSYEKPRDTISTNVMGTLNVLEAATHITSVRGLVCVTTDKVYAHSGAHQAFVEEDSLGGHDPYSSSKAMADILASSWSLSYPSLPIAIARAGNVIGGGDISKDRLLPDVLQAFEQGRPALIRNPHAVRPWQHVLDCLNGYLLLTNALVQGHGRGAWNFGPEPGAQRTVSDAATVAAKAWGDGAYWKEDVDEHPHEAALLTLDSTKARRQLGWQDHLSFEEAIDWTIEWSQRVNTGQDPRTVTEDQIERFLQRRA